MTISKPTLFKWEYMKPFGVLIEGDLRERLSPEDAGLFRKLYLENSLVVARNQRLTLDEQVAVMEYIGPVIKSSETIHIVSNDPKKGDLGKGELRFHSDLAGTSCPRTAGSLHAIDVVDDNTCTMFASAIHGYENLSPNMKDQIEGLYIVQVNSSVNDGSKIAIGDYIDPDSPSAIHPLVLQHPVTGLPVLYISHLDTAIIQGLSKQAMGAVADELFKTLYDSENIVKHSWRNGDLVIWDNIALQHARGDCSNIGNRTLQRVVICEKLLPEMYNDRYDRDDTIPAFRSYRRKGSATGDPALG